MKKISFKVFSAFLLMILCGCVLSGRNYSPENPVPVNPGSEIQGTAIVVSNYTELITALVTVQAGNTILLESGIYTGPVETAQFTTVDGSTRTRAWYFRGAAEGTLSKPITLKSRNPSDPAVLSGAGWAQNGYGLYITGDYWVLQDLIIQEAAKGLVLDHSNGSVIENVEIHNIGQEGLHIRDGSSNTLVHRMNVHHVGKKNDGYGEGIYIGSDHSVWLEGDGSTTGEKGQLYSREVHDTIVRNSTIGPEITAEPFDIKEGSSGTIIEHCIIYGSGVSGNHYADSHIDIKGFNTIVKYNTFYQENNSQILRSIMIVPRPDAGYLYSGHHNYIHDNIFHLESSTDMAVANSGSSENYAWNNTRQPASGNTYNSRILQRIPAEYAP